MESTRSFTSVFDVIDRLSEPLKNIKKMVADLHGRSNLKIAIKKRILGAAIHPGLLPWTDAHPASLRTGPLSRHLVTSARLDRARRLYSFSSAYLTGLFQLLKLHLHLAPLHHDLL